MNDITLNLANLFIFCKDQHHHFLFCNEKFAQIAGMDSPAQIVGNTDEEMICHTKKEIINKAHQQVFYLSPRFS